MIYLFHVTTLLFKMRVFWLLLFLITSVAAQSSDSWDGDDGLLDAFLYAVLYQLPLPILAAMAFIGVCVLVYAKLTAYTPIAVHHSEYVGKRGGTLMTPSKPLYIEYTQDGSTDTLRLVVDTADETTGTLTAHGENSYGQVTCNGSFSDTAWAFSMEYMRRPGLFRYYFRHTQGDWQGTWEHEPRKGMWQHGTAKWIRAIKSVDSSSLSSAEVMG